MTHTPFTRLLDALIAAARDLGILVARGQAASKRYAAADARLQRLRGELIKMYEEEKK